MLGVTVALLLAAASDAPKLSVGLGDGSVRLSPYVAPAYTPELGFIVSAGGALTWDGDPLHPELPRSSLALTLGIGTAGAYFVQSRMNTFWRNDDLRLVMDVDVRDQVDHYFGVGFTNGFTRPLGAETTAMKRTWWKVTPTLLQRIAGPLYAGALLDFSGTVVREPSAGVLADPDYRRAGGTNVSTGGGVQLQLDTRDVPVDAWRGVYLAASWRGYGTGLGANTMWHAVNVDYRQYVRLFRDGSTLCWQLKHRSASGEVPWSELTQIGTPWDLRAYRWGQYRDKSGTTLVLEYRFMWEWPPGWLLGGVGVSAWGGVGVMGPGAIPDFTRALPAGGVGLRIDLQKRLVLRLDVGFGREARGVYLNFLQAF